ncbi:flavodoxin reductase [Flavobacterium silvisoli]|uniref:Flavodoxin reductase n=1 Tax=Flavobacterium silvisoli TaxID=2529433 RepID=A0A4Q9YNK4_9FLAO|nr:FAD-binding oxidoreductase [Flavobacterium silvisoli]TBX64824.1 flavodoxin reductase [Flavobacterium silvisoli]
MNEHIVKVLEAKFITHDVKRFVVEKPNGFDFIPGQATEVSINLPEWKTQRRPFTFTNLRESNYLEFMIKLYNDHEGVTNKLGKTNAGAEIILHDVFGAIQYKGPGVFIAAGSGITPFISIFRELYKHNLIKGNRLIYANKTSEDIIMGAELQKMLKNNFVNVLTRENTIGFIGKRIDRNFLIENIVDFSQRFYVCGPDDFVKDITKYLVDLGADFDSLVFEK